MSTNSVDLPNETAKRLQEMAGRLGVELQDLVKLSLSGLVRRTDPDFTRIIDRIASPDKASEALSTQRIEII